MKLTWHAGCLTVLMTVFAPFARGEDIHETLRQIKAQYDRLGVALSHKDMKKYASLHTADCTFTGPDGKIHKLAELCRALAKPGAPQIESVSTEIRMIAPADKGVTVDTELTLTMAAVDKEGKQGPKGAKHNIALHTMDHDIWIKSASGWLRRRGVMKSIVSLQVDGKTVPRPHGVPVGGIVN